MVDKSALGRVPLRFQEGGMMRSVNNLLKFRREKNVTEQELADSVGIPVHVLRRMELGRVPVPSFLAFKFAKALGATLHGLFSGAASILKDVTNIDDLLKLSNDEKSAAKFREVGLDPEAWSWYLKLSFRNGVTRIFLTSSFEKERLEFFLLNEGDKYFVFSSVDRDVILNMRHLVFAHTLFQEGALENEHRLESVRVYLASTSAALEFEVESEDPLDLEDDDEERGQCQHLIFAAELGPEQNEYLRLTDIDGERAYFRAADVVMIEIPDWVLDSRLLPDEEQEGDDESDSQAPFRTPDDPPPSVN